MINKTQTVVTASALRGGDRIANFSATVSRVTSLGQGRYTVTFTMRDGSAHVVDCSKSRKWILLNR